jgi:uncharacterized membrane protein
MKLPLANGKYRSTALIVGRLLAFSAVAVWFSYIWPVTHYDSTRPQVPDVAAGRVISQNTHGHYVYLTAEESSRLTNLEIAAFSLFITGFLIGGLFAQGGFTRQRAKPWELRR